MPVSFAILSITLSTTWRTISQGRIVPWHVWFTSRAPAFYTEVFGWKIKTAVPRVGYFAYFKNTEGNTFGVMENDESAR